jgi:hypothetical protein
VKWEPVTRYWYPACHKETHTGPSTWVSHDTKKVQDERVSTLLTRVLFMMNIQKYLLSGRYWDKNHVRHP